MEKLILERDKEDFYILEVNDKGDAIEFDLTDIGLAEKFMNASEKVLEIEKRKQEKILNASEEFKNDRKKLIKEVIKINKEEAIEMRKTFDSFLGDGACQKIFGDKNNYAQFDELLNALEPHFNKMEIKLNKAKKRLMNKYLPKDNDVM